MKRFKEIKDEKKRGEEIERECVCFREREREREGGQRERLGKGGGQTSVLKQQIKSK